MKHARMFPVQILGRLCVGSALLGCGATAWAATSTTSLTVSATVASTCTVGAGALSFGAAVPNPINADVDAQAEVTATCSSGTAYTIASNTGGGAGASFAARKLTAGPSTLDYALYTNPGRTSVWGDGSAGSEPLRGSGTGAPQVIPVYGRIPRGQTVPAGAYSDTIVVTLTF